MTVMRFQEIRHQGRKNLPCPSCGKKVRRTRSFTQTVNPFNRNDDGSVRTPYEIRQALMAEARVWESEPVPCATCGKPSSPPGAQS